MTALYGLISAIMFKIRGGLRIPRINKKFPLCKWWFATWFACLACILNGWEWQYFITVFIASRMATCIAGWGEAVGCALGISKPDPNRQDYLDFDEFCDNFHIGSWKLVDHPQLFGVVWLTMRGVLLTFLMLSGLFARKVKDDGKHGWHIAELAYGFWLGIGCVLWR